MTQIERRVPAGVELPVAGDAGAIGALLQRLEPRERAPHLRLAADDADEVLHQFLERELHLERSFVAGAPFERLDGALRRVVDLTRVDRGRLLLARELRGVLAGALAEHQQVGERVAAEPVGAVDARRALARGEESGHGRHLRLAVNAHAPHDVVRRRADLHGFLRDVDVGELLELVVHARQLLADVFFRVGQPRLDPRDVEEDAAVRAAAPRLHLAHDAARDVVACEQLGRPARVRVSLRVPEALVFVVRGLRAIQVGDVVEHEATPRAVLQHAPFAADGFRHEEAADARRPHHARRMELDELHVHQFGAGVVRERMAVAGAFPAVARDLERAADPARREDDRLRAKHLEAAALALVRERARDARSVLEERDDRALHVHGHALVDAVVLERADHLQPRAIADVRQTRIAVAAEVALEDPAVIGAIEQRAPGFQLADAVRRLLRVQLRHPPVVHVLAAAHRVGEVHLPVVAIVDVRERRGDAALRHDRVRLAEERLADQPDGDAGRRGFDRGAQTRAAGADHEDLVLVRLVLRHQRILKSVQTPIEQSRTYRSAKPTMKRLVHAHTMCWRFRQLAQAYVV